MSSSTGLSARFAMEETKIAECSCVMAAIKAITLFVCDLDCCGYPQGHGFAETAVDWKESIIPPRLESHLVH